MKVLIDLDDYNQPLPTNTNTNNNNNNHYPNTSNQPTLSTLITQYKSFGRKILYIYKTALFDDNTTVFHLIQAILEALKGDPLIANNPELYQSIELEDQRDYELYLHDSEAEDNSLEMDKDRMVTSYQLTNRVWDSILFLWGEGDGG